MQNTPPMPNRPLALTIIGWYLIISGILTILMSFFGFKQETTRQLMELSPLPISVQYLMIAIGVLISLVCGFLLLKGKVLGRNVYLIWSVISMLIMLVTAPSKLMLLPSVIIVALIAFFLFRPSVNEYFSETNQTG